MKLETVGLLWSDHSKRTSETSAVSQTEVTHMRTATLGAEWLFETDYKVNFGLLD